MYQKSIRETFLSDRTVCPEIKEISDGSVHLGAWNILEQMKAEYKDQHTGGEAMEGDTQITEGLLWTKQRIWTLLGRGFGATEEV